MSINADNKEEDNDEINHPRKYAADEDNYSIPIESVRAAYQKTESPSLFEELNASKLDENESKLEENASNVEENASNAEEIAFKIEENASKLDTKVDDTPDIEEDADDQSKLAEATGSLVFMASREVDDEDQTIKVTKQTTTSSNENQNSMAFFQHNNDTFEELIRAQDEATKQLNQIADLKRKLRVSINGNQSNYSRTSMVDVPLQNSPSQSNEVRVTSTPVWTRDNDYSTITRIYETQPRRCCCSDCCSNRCAIL